MGQSSCHVYRRKGIAVPGDDIKPDNWKGQDKLAVVTETAALNESELGEYCRKESAFYLPSIASLSRADVPGLS